MLNKSIVQEVKILYKRQDENGQTDTGVINIEIEINSNKPQIFPIWNESLKQQWDAFIAVDAKNCEEVIVEHPANSFDFDEVHEMLDFCHVIIK